MKVILVNGSPKKNGCTNRGLEEVQKTLKESNIDTEIYWIGNKAIRGCIACNKCRELGKCVFNDQINEFAKKAEEADGFVFGTPVYYSSPNGALLSFMDRLFYSSDRDTFRLKPGAAIVSARRGGTTAAFEVLNKYFTISEMSVISSTYWNNIHGITPSDVEKDLEGLQIMRVLGRNMAFYLQCKKIALENGIELPKQEVRVGTNFIR